VNVGVMPRTRAGLEVATLDGEAVVFDPTHFVVHHLNAAGLAVWERCDGATSVEHVVVELAARFDVDSALVRADLDELLDRLRAEGLLEASA
jgi:PqqD family protein of HPr-rel-A system